MIICSNCFNEKESELVEFINSLGQSQQCEVCHTVGNSAKLDELFDFFQELLNCFQQSEAGTLLCDKIQQDWKFFPDNKSANSILKEVLTSIETDIELSSKVDYTDAIKQNVTYWDKLKKELREHRRFIPDKEILKHLNLNSVFDLSYWLGGDTKLYRARVHHKSREKPYQPQEMMAPKPEDTVSGRANPSGIPFLYLSENEKTVAHEVRASYPDELSIGVFETANNKHIDIVDFSGQALLYQADNNKVSQIIKSQLLRNSISDDLSKPMRRYDSDLDYIPTQFICEFIKNNIAADGIRFNSSLDINGKNLVIFDDKKVSCQNVKLKIVDEIDIKTKLKQ